MLREDEKRALEDRVEAGRVLRCSVVQSLWSDYGQILRVECERASVIAKRVRWPASDGVGHARKVRSYEIEANFYRRYSARCPARVPRFLGEVPTGDGALFFLEDLNDAGFPERRRALSDDELSACLSWLARFHAAHLGRAPEDLWPVGTYWHLDTRPDELAAMGDTDLARAAPIIDEQLQSARFQTFVHGDAKVANFCFGTRGVAAVDFQYVGGGPGIKDVAYFISSCLDEDECEARESELLDFYFAELSSLLDDARAVEGEWRALYPVAWADFYRFLAGWRPGHWKMHRYSARLVREVLDRL